MSFKIFNFGEKWFGTWRDINVGIRSPFSTLIDLLVNLKVEKRTFAPTCIGTRVQTAIWQIEEQLQTMASETGTKNPL